jgi:hypothetical protein
MIVCTLRIIFRGLRKLTLVVVVFDNGNLKENPEEAQKVIDVLLSDMVIDPDQSNTNNGESSHSQLSEQQGWLIDVHKLVWTRITESSPVGS